MNDQNEGDHNKRPNEQEKQWASQITGGGPVITRPIGDHEWSRISGRAAVGRR